MKIQNIQTEAITIFDVPALDPVIVVFFDACPSQGCILVKCYGKAWTACWMAMGDLSVREFVASCDADYLATKLWRDSEKRTKESWAYLLRIAKVIIAALGTAEAGKG